MGASSVSARAMGRKATTQNRSCSPGSATAVLVTWKTRGEIRRCILRRPVSPGSHQRGGTSGCDEQCRGIGADTGCGKERERRLVEGEHTVACIDDHDRLLRDIERGPTANASVISSMRSRARRRPLYGMCRTRISRQESSLPRRMHDVLRRAAHTVDELLDDFRIGEVNRLGQFAAAAGAPSMVRVVSSALSDTTCSVRQSTSRAGSGSSSMRFAHSSRPRPTSDRAAARSVWRRS